MWTMIVSSVGVAALAAGLIGHRLWQRHTAVTRLVEWVNENWWPGAVYFEDPADVVKKLGAEEWAVSALVRELSKSKSSVRGQAAYVLERFGPTSRPAIPVLIGWLERDDDLRHQAARTLASIGSDAVPALVPLLDSTNKAIRIAAAEALGGMGPAAEPGVPALARMLIDHDYNIFRTAEDVLPKLRRAAMPTISEHLLLPDYEVGETQHGGGCSWAIRAVIEIGPDAKDAIPVLVDLLQNWRCAELVGEALTSIGPEGVRALTIALKHATPQIQADALYGVSRVFDACPEAAQLAVDSLEIDLRVVRERSLEAISVHCDRARSFKPDLDRFLTDDSPGIRAAAAKAHWRVYKQPEPVLRTLIGVLRSNQSRPQYEAARTLPELGSYAAEAVPALIELFKSPDHFTRCAAAYALRDIAARPEVAVPPLMAALSDREVRHSAGEALAAYGSQAKLAIPHLAQAWRRARLENSYDAGDLAKSIERICPQIKLPHGDFTKPVDQEAIEVIDQEVRRALELTSQSDARE